ncbi:hypothetical protein E3A20_10170, partial [Planctomyces bekefii]
GIYWLVNQFFRIGIASVSIVAARTVSTDNCSAQPESTG